MASTPAGDAALALATTAKRALGRAAVGMHQFGYVDARDGGPWFAEGASAGAEACTMPAASLPRRR